MTGAASWLSPPGREVEMPPAPQGRRRHRGKGELALGRMRWRPQVAGHTGKQPVAAGLYAVWALSSFLEKKPSGSQGPLGRRRWWSAAPTWLELASATTTSSAEEDWWESRAEADRLFLAAVKAADMAWRWTSPNTVRGGPRWMTPAYHVGVTTVETIKVGSRLTIFQDKYSRILWLSFWRINIHHKNIYCTGGVHSTILLY